MGARDADIIETGPPRTPARSHRLTAVAVAVVIAGTAGYAVGSRRTATPPTPVPTASALPAGAPAVVTTGGRCWAQPGAQLQLGLEVVNRSGSAATLRRLEPVLPLGGLRPTASAWGGCGQLPPVPAGDLTLAAGATTWLTMTFDVLDRCPAPFPVGFTLTYTQAGRPARRRRPARLSRPRRRAVHRRPVSAAVVAAGWRTARMSADDRPGPFTSSHAGGMGVHQTRRRAPAVPPGIGRAGTGCCGTWEQGFHRGARRVRD